MALILSGDTGVPASGMPTGSVIQTVSYSTNAQTTNATTSWVASQVSATITPISTTSKIIITVLGGTLDNNAGSNSQCYLTIFRNGATNLGFFAYF